MPGSTMPEVFVLSHVAYINTLAIFLTFLQSQSYFLGDFDISADEASIPQTQSLTLVCSTSAKSEKQCRAID